MRTHTSLLTLLAPTACTAQFLPPFVPLNGLFATSKLRNDMARYRTSARMAQAAETETVEKKAAEDPLSERARDCADHFGECSVEEMEGMRLSLHAERLKNLLTSSSDASWPQAELDRRLLEQDLSLQITLLKEHIGADEMLKAEIEAADARVRHLGADDMVNDVSRIGPDVHPQVDDPPVDASELHMRGDEGGAPGQQVAMPRGGGGGAAAVAVRPVVPVPVPVPLSDAVAPEDHAHWSPWIEDVAVEGWKAFDLGAAETAVLAATVALIMLLPQMVHHGHV